MHSVLMISWQRKKIMIDCGADWSGKQHKIRPDAILLTHAHMDHAGGLKSGAACPVYATVETWDRIRVGPVPERVIVHEQSPFKLFGVEFEAFPVEHSIRAPAIGYRFTAAGKSVFYAPDLVRILDETNALKKIGLYVGDGAAITRPVLRNRDGVFIGHASIRTQLEWCAKQSVPRAIFSHCGKEIVAGDHRAAVEKVRGIGEQVGVKAAIACDGLQILVN